MKRIIWAVLILVAVGAGYLNAVPETPTTTILLRITDGIGQQFACVSSSMANTYGFGGAGDTLSTDSTVARGCQMNVHRIMEGSDIALAELLPSFVSIRTQLDSSYMYSKWSSICWAINNAYADSGGMSGVLTARDTVYANDKRLSPKFARLARANGIYLNQKVVFPPAMNLGYMISSATDSTITFSDSNAVDSTLYGPVYAGTANPEGWFGYIKSGGTGGCSLLVYGSNQNLAHGRKWVYYSTGGGAGSNVVFAPSVAGDSLYNIDSVKIKACSGNHADTVLFKVGTCRVDSL